jgi:hypothetical protein
MKKLILFVFALIGMSSIQAQSTISDAVMFDTLSTSGSLDTLTFTQAYDRAYPFLWEANVFAASLSGTDTATVYIQHAARGRTKWVTVDTITIGGASSAWKKTGECLGGRIRYYILAPSSTQSTEVTINHQIVRSVPTRL